jgi:hypothetical protein
MEFAIPISQFDVSKVRWATPRVSSFRKTIPFMYEDNSILLNNLIILLYPLRVVEIDNEKNQLVLEESKKHHYLSKIDQFQQSVSSELEKRAKAWSDTSNVKSPLQPWLKSNKLTLYLSDKPELLNFYTDNSPAVFSDKIVKPGDMIRAVVKIQGLSLQMSEDDIWTGKSRIQHHILQLYKVSSASD